MVRRLFKDTTSSVSIQVFRYILSGGLAYVVDYSMLVVFVEIFKMYYLTASALAFFLGSVTSYILNVTWVFDKRTFDNRFVEIGIFFMIGAAGLVLNQFCIWFFTENVDLYYLYSKVIATAAVFVLNFFARKYILFR